MKTMQKENVVIGLSAVGSGGKAVGIQIYQGHLGLGAWQGAFVQKVAGAHANIHMGVGHMLVIVGYLFFAAAFRRSWFFCFQAEFCAS